MPWQGSAPNQTYVRSDGVRTGAAVNVTAAGAGVNNTAALADARENDFATALNLALKRDGGNQPTADLPMNSHKFTGMEQGSDRTDSIRLDQVQDGDLIYAEASGTANSIALTTSPSSSPVEGMSIVFFAEATNTTATTVDLNGAGAVALQFGTAALIGGEVKNGQAHRITFDGTQWQLENSARLSDLHALAKTDGNIIVGDGTSWVAESGATARTSLGLGSSDSPTFANPQVTTLEVGNASDTTLSRASAGVLAVEGANLLRHSQNLADVASAATAFGNIKQAASDSATGVLEIAVASEMETATSTSLAVTPGRQHNHPGHPKAFAKINASTGTPVLNRGYNVSSITDVGPGDYNVNFTTAFSAADYGVAGYARAPSDSFADFLVCGRQSTTYSTTACNLRTTAPAQSESDTQFVSASFYGDQ